MSRTYFSQSPGLMIDGEGVYDRYWGEGPAYTVTPFILQHGHIMRSLGRGQRQTESSLGTQCACFISSCTFAGRVHVCSCRTLEVDIIQSLSLSLRTVFNEQSLSQLNLGYFKIGQCNQPTCSGAPSLSLGCQTYIFKTNMCSGPRSSHACGMCLSHQVTSLGLFLLLSQVFSCLLEKGSHAVQATSSLEDTVAEMALNSQSSSMHLPVQGLRVCATAPALMPLPRILSTAGYMQKHGDSSAAPPPARRNLS